ncbi:hypothetical protein QUA56_28220 [Microcoleus sp. N3A4]
MLSAERKLPSEPIGDRSIGAAFELYFIHKTCAIAPAAQALCY